VSNSTIEAKTKLQKTFGTQLNEKSPATLVLINDNVSSVIKLIKSYQSYCKNDCGTVLSFAAFQNTEQFNIIKKISMFVAY